MPRDGEEHHCSITPPPTHRSAHIPGATKRRPATSFLDRARRRSTGRAPRTFAIHRASEATTGVRARTSVEAARVAVVARRRPYAFVIVGCAALFFVASLIWYLNRSVGITLNGSDASVHIGATITQVIEDEGFADSCRPGNLLAVDDSVITRGGGERYSVTLDGEEVDPDSYDTVKLEGGEELEIHDGADVYEDHKVEATTIEPTITVEGNGAIGYVSTLGVFPRPLRGVDGRAHRHHRRSRGGAESARLRGHVPLRLARRRGCALHRADLRRGPSAYTQQILDILEEKGVSATFFLQGDAVEENPAAAKAIAEAGHEIGSNAYNDVDLSTLSGEELRSQLTRGFDAIENATGECVNLLRAPYASFSTENWAESMDIVGAVVSWNIDSGDWLLPGAESVQANVVGAAHNGNIVLLTDNDATGEQLVEALPGIIDQLKEDGYTIVTLSELIATDEDFAEELDLAHTSMPEDAALPVMPSDDEEE